jgi:1,4-alpha-glucan branching enzyme
LTERALTLRYRPAHLVGAVALGALVVVGLRARPAPPSAARAVAAAPVHPAPPDHAPVLVRFAFAAPDARQVSVAGDFNGWRTDLTPLERRPDGTWTVMLPLGAGNWSYSFVVDGKWVEDPLADTYREDGFGGRNAVVRIGG